MKTSQQLRLGKKSAEWLFYKAEEANDDPELEIIQAIALVLATHEEVLDLASLLTDIGLFSEHKRWEKNGQTNNISELQQDIKQQLSDIS